MSEEDGDGQTDIFYSQGNRSLIYMVSESSHAGFTYIANLHLWQSF